MVEAATSIVQVLLLEDSPLDAELSIARLERAGLSLEVALAHDRASFIELLHARVYDLILADYALPDFDGVAALKLAREVSPHVPFIFISGRLGEEVAIDTLQRGATDYVLKQRLERLVPAVNRALKEAAEHATRMHVEEKFRESETRFHYVINALPQMVWITSADDVLTYTNHTWKEMVPEGVTKWCDHSLIHPVDYPSVVHAWETGLVTHEAFSCEARLLRSTDQTYRWQLLRLVPLVASLGERGNTQGAGEWLGTATDMQEQKLNEEALRTAEKLAVTGRMAAAIAHEINNPLESLTNLIFLAKLESAQNERAMTYLDMTENELERVSVITKQTLQFYRDPLFPSEVDAREILEDVLRLFHTRLVSKGIQTSLEAETGIVFQAIKGEMRQVMINLVNNAIDAVQPGGRIRAAAHFLPAENDGEPSMVEVTLEDDGVGIAPEQVARLFQPFFSTKGAHGTGLGLWVSKGIVEKHGGTIELKTHQEGPRPRTVAKVRLPIQAVQDLDADASAETSTN